MDRQAHEVNRIEEGLRRRIDELFEQGGLVEVDRRKVRIEIRAGKPWQEILRFAWQERVELIVLGSHGYTGVKHMLIGSQTEKVVRRAHCATLVVKPRDYEPDPDITGEPRPVKAL
jgi:nucleotide-binding universal stress UspA family protein